MYFITLAASFYMRPPSMSSPLRTLSAVACFAIGAVVGWPFALLLAVPFVLEEISVWGGDHVPPDAQLSWLMGRWKRLILCGVIASLVFVSETAKALPFSAEHLPRCPWSLLTRWRMGNSLWCHGT